MEYKFQTYISKKSCLIYTFDIFAYFFSSDNPVKVKILRKVLPKFTYYEL